MAMADMKDATTEGAKSVLKAVATGIGLRVLWALHCMDLCERATVRNTVTYSIALSAECFTNSTGTVPTRTS